MERDDVRERLLNTIQQCAHASRADAIKTHGPAVEALVTAIAGAEPVPAAAVADAKTDVAKKS